MFHSSKHRVREQKASKALCQVNLTRPGARPDLQHYLSLTFLSPGPRLQCMLLLFVFSMEIPPPQDLSIPCGRCRTLESEPMTKWPLISQPLKWEQVGSCRLFSSGPLRVLWLLLFFSLSVLRPRGSQDPGCFCLRAGPFLFIRRESTSCICMGSYCLTLERWGSGGQTDHRSVTRQT